MKRRMGVILIVLLLSVSVTSCATRSHVTFDSDVQGAEVYLDGRLMGETPVSTRLSNGIWEDPRVVVEMEGYRTVFTNLEREVKPVNLVFGMVLWWPSLLWVYGPDDYQYFRLVKQE